MFPVHYCQAPVGATRWVALFVDGAPAREEKQYDSPARPFAPGNDS